MNNLIKLSVAFALGYYLAKNQAITQSIILPNPLSPTNTGDDKGGNNIIAPTPDPNLSLPSIQGQKARLAKMIA